MNARLFRLLYGEVTICPPRLSPELPWNRNRNGKQDSGEKGVSGFRVFLDTNNNGALSFEEWAAKTIGKFQGADSDKNGWLTPAEYATTAPPPPKRQRCSC